MTPCGTNRSIRHATVLEDALVVLGDGGLERWAEGADRWSPLWQEEEEDGSTDTELYHMVPLVY